MFIVFYHAASFSLYFVGYGDGGVLVTLPWDYAHKMNNLFGYFNYHTSIDCIIWLDIWALKAICFFYGFH